MALRECFCHQKHDRVPVKFDKLDRQRFRRMSNKAALSMLLAAYTYKINSLQCCQTAFAAVIAKQQPYVDQKQRQHCHFGSNLHPIAAKAQKDVNGSHLVFGLATIGPTRGCKCDGGRACCMRGTRSRQLMLKCHVGLQRAFDW